jgi:hypothetical protein
MFEDDREFTNLFVYDTLYIATLMRPKHHHNAAPSNLWFLCVCECKYPTPTHPFPQQLKVPQRSKRMQSLLPTPLHHLIIALHIRRDEDNLCAKPRPRIF